MVTQQPVIKTRLTTQEVFCPKFLALIAALHCYVFATICSARINIETHACMW